MNKAQLIQALATANLGTAEQLSKYNKADLESMLAAHKADQQREANVAANRKGAKPNSIKAEATELYGGFILRVAEMAIDRLNDKFENSETDSAKMVIEMSRDFLNLLVHKVPEAKAEQALTEQLNNLHADVATRICYSMTSAAASELASSWYFHNRAIEAQREESESDTQREEAPREAYAGTQENGRPSFEVVEKLTMYLHVLLSQAFDKATVVRLGRRTAYNAGWYPQLPIGWAGEDKSGRVVAHYTTEDFLEARDRARLMAEELKVEALREARKHNVVDMSQYAA